jgi:hypothetical protein
MTYRPPSPSEGGPFYVASFHMMQVAAIGLDIAANVFQVQGAVSRGREKLLRAVAGHLRTRDRD